MDGDRVSSALKPSVGIRRSALAGVWRTMFRAFATAAGVTGVPSWNMAPGRIENRQSSPSALLVQETERPVMDRRENMSTYYHARQKRQASPRAASVIDAVHSGL